MTELLQWWNLIFVVPFGLAALLLLFMSFGLLDFGDHDADVDVDADADVDADVDADADVDHDFGTGHDMVLHHDWEAGAGHDHDATHEGAGGLMKALGVLGVGRAPLSLLLLCFCLVWGFTGVASNLLLDGVLRSPPVYVWVSLGVALLASLFLTRTLAFTFARFMSLDESYSVPRSGLVGQRAEVRFTITENSGTAMLYDAFGTLREVSCRVPSGAKPLPHGARVVLMRFDAQRDLFFVRPDPLENETAPDEIAPDETAPDEIAAPRQDELE